MLHLQRNQVADLHKQKLFFSHIFSIVDQLPGLSISRLANVEDFFNVNKFFKCKYKREYKQLFINYICVVCYLKLRFIASPVLQCRI